MKLFVIGVRRWVIVATLLCAICSGVGLAVGTWRPLPKAQVVRVNTVIHDRPVPPLPPCRDDAVLEYGAFYKQCDSRAKLEIYPSVGLWTLYKCACLR